MEISTTDATVYIGTGAGRPIREGLDNAKTSIDIITPYISLAYLNYLLKRQTEGVEINLVISTEYTQKTEEKAEIAKRLVEQKREEIQGARSKRKRFRFYALCLVLLAGAAIYVHFAPTVAMKIPGTPIFAGLAALGAFLLHNEAGKIRLFQYSYAPRLKFAAYRPWTSNSDKDCFLMHAKVYVFDKICAHIGSVNLTTAAFLFNCEVRTDIHDPQASHKLSNQIRGMIAKPWGQVKNYEEIGQEVYAEPPC